MLDLLSIYWDEKITYVNANQSFNEFFSEIALLLDKYMPFKKISQKDYKRQFKPWITNGLLKSCDQRDKIYHKFIKCKDPTAKSNLLAQYKYFRNQIVDLIRTSKKQYYINYFSEHNKDLRKIWIGIKQIINIKANKHDVPSCIEDNGSLISEPSEIATTFNNYFADIAPKIADDRRWGGSSNFKDFWPNRNPSSLVFLPTDKEEVIRIISTFKLGKASGPTSIPGNILQLIKFEIATPLSRIINQSIETGIHPEKLKLASVIPVYKKGSKLSTSNYRPISLLSNLNKIFEKIMFQRCYNFIESNEILYEHQYGFRKKYSTGHALINISEQIRTALDNNKYAIGVFVDFQKAFDTVDHNILIKKLERFGISGNCNKWFQSYLTNRKQFVSILGYKSNQRTIFHGVPQGSVLGPLLFLLFINDLHRVIKFSTVFHFADDTNLLLIGDSPSKIQKQMNCDLRWLYRWLIANSISLNAAKTELIIFKKPKMKTYNLKIKLNGTKLYPSNYTRYLGVFLDSDLSGISHCNQLLPKLRRANGMLAKTRYHLLKKDLISLYYSIFSSILNYGSQIWGLLSNPALHKIDRLQKSAVRIITFSDYDAHTATIFRELRILKFHDYIKLQNILFVYDFKKGSLPSSFRNFFDHSMDIRALTRAELNSATEFVNATGYNQVKYGRKSITHTSVALWNHFARLVFPDIDLIALSRNQIKHLVTNHFLDNYTDIADDDLN